MITLHSIKDDPKSSRLEQKLKELVLAFKTVYHQADECSHSIPYIEDGDAIITNDEKIEEWIVELESELKWQRSLSGDGCYIHPDSGKVC